MSCDCRGCEYLRFRDRCFRIGAGLVIAACLLWCVLVIYQFIY
jgi:hypothetical protein